MARIDEAWDMGKAATQNYYLWPSTLTTRSGPANIDAYPSLSLHKTNLPPRRFLSYEIRAQYVGRPTSLLPGHCVHSPLSNSLCRSRRFLCSRLLQPTPKVYHARRHSSLFLTTSPVHFIYERLSSVLPTDALLLFWKAICDGERVRGPGENQLAIQKCRRHTASLQSARVLQ